MVSTRQMSSVGGSSGSSESAGPSHAEPVAVSRVTRHSSTLLPGSSSPHASTSKCSAIVPAPKTCTTNFLDLPIEVIDKIFSYLGFKTVSHLRMVNIFILTLAIIYLALYLILYMLVTMNSIFVWRLTRRPMFSRG